jgi:hypothetical protein
MKIINKNIYFFVKKKILNFIKKCYENKVLFDKIRQFEFFFNLNFVYLEYTKKKISEFFFPFLK